jgi:citrate lyase beta subunit
MPTPKIDSARSFLFVPADRPQRFGKALEAGADVVVVDLEDAVLPEAKGMARQALAAWLDPARPVVIRINGVGTAWHEADRELARHPGVAAVMLPKAGDAADLATFGVPVIPLVESARGMVPWPTSPERPGSSGSPSARSTSCSISASRPTDPRSMSSARRWR